MAAHAQERLVIISGPAGAGKSTIVRRLLHQCQMPLRLSISATTRPRRPQEADGIDYHFLSRDEFARRRTAGEFLECKEVFGRGDWYGTLKSEVQSGFAEGKWVILEIDVEGATSVLESHPGAITIFLHTGSIEELERRLRGRGTESEASIQRRLEVARHELERKSQYRFEVINETLDQAVYDICQILVHSAQ
jgi:guanylate kinase